MAAYLIVTAEIHDRAAFVEGYAKAAASLIGQFGGRYLLRGPGAQLLEGDFGNGGSVVISEWPDREAALAFWNSSKYAEAKQLRDGLANVQVLLIEAPKIEA